MPDLFKAGEAKSKASAAAAAARERTNEAIISFSETPDNLFKDLLKKELHLSWFKGESDVMIGQTYMALIMLAKKLFPPYKVLIYDSAGNPELEYDSDGKLERDKDGNSIPKTKLINDVYSFWLTDLNAWLSFKRNIEGAQQKILRTDIGEHYLKSEEKTSERGEKE